MNQAIKQLLRELPAVHHFTHNPKVLEWIREKEIAEPFFADIVKEVIQEVREKIIDETLIDLSYDLVWKTIQEKLIHSKQNNLQPVINGTGVILHTNLGRAVLADEAAKQMSAVALGYSNLEYQIDQGKRGSRHDHVENLIQRLTGAEAAMVVNNNAAAVFLILREIAKGREVIVSRGQLVEIGGSFRVSEIMKESGAILQEVGTTNKTHLRDYEQALTEQTALLLKVHTSNFALTGFTHSVSLEELARLGQKHEIPVYEDLGSGVLYDLRKHGIGSEPVIQESIEQGADLVSFSGDKLLGGPQVGVIAGKRKWIERLKKNQLARVLRVDKVTLAALEATFRLYLDPQKAAQKIPTLHDMLLQPDEIRQKAYTLQKLVNEFPIEIKPEQSEVGGGSLPGVLLPTYVVAIHHPNFPAHEIERRLRKGTPAIIGRIVKDEYLLDFRTIQERQIAPLAEMIKKRLQE